MGKVHIQNLDISRCERLFSHTCVTALLKIIDTLGLFVESNVKQVRSVGVYLAVFAQIIGNALACTAVAWL
jgi:hypothetical protein